ncbi:mitotic checkpoint serine/threonine-protein kinase BUB1-like, partial [Micropterus dolomieu]|uniref:mitotic checkpoint serine/threonine-protein kinase BUB1-like n=1 Tax=Micropterus dolomieu TaxID=147949 RepID=UPI001E8D99BE
MAEGLPVQVGPSAYQSEPSSTQTHPIAGAGHQEEGVVSQKPEYCIELLTRGREEFSFEELRAERYFKRREEREIEEKLRRGEELKKQLRKELEEKKRLVELMKSQMGPEGSASRIRDAAGPPAVEPPAAASFQIYEDSRSAAAARPAGTSDASQYKLQDDVFLRPDERGLCLKVQCPQQGFFGASPLPQVDAGIQPHNSNLPSAPQNGLTQTPTVVQTSVEPVSKTRQELSPIQETSVEANSLTSLGMSAGHGSPLQEDQDQEELDPVPSHGESKPCLDLMTVTQAGRESRLDPCLFPAHESPRPVCFLPTSRLAPFVSCPRVASPRLFPAHESPRPVCFLPTSRLAPR